jgi:indolepyruvate ferredoxin oxidoreductase beta subunit
VPVSIARRRPETAEDRKAAQERRRTQIAATAPERLVGPALREQARSVLDLPAAARSTVLHGLVRTALYQDESYAQRYLDRVRAIAVLDPDPLGEAALTTAAGRNVALWMCYQDTIQVAAQKTRRARLERVRAEAGAGDGRLMQVREFLHPQVEEITDTLPARLGAALLRSKTFRRVTGVVTRDGVIVNTTSVTGYTALAVLARLRPLRPRSLRFVREQAAIEAWLDLARSLAGDDPALAREVLDCQQVLKGYGATHAHGRESFDLLMRAARALAPAGGAAPRLAALRSAALADEDGGRLRAGLAALGLPADAPA